MKDLAILDLLSDSSLTALAKRIAGQNADDLIQEVALVLLEMEEEKWLEINEGGYLRWYVIRTMINMATSNRSTFARKYQLNSTEGIEFDDIPDSNDYNFIREETLIILEELLEDYHWYDRDMLTLYFKEGSYRKVAAATGIPFKSVGNTVKKTITKLKEDYNGRIIKLNRSSGIGSDIRGGTDDRLED